MQKTIYSHKTASRLSSARPLFLGLVDDLADVDVACLQKGQRGRFHNSLEYGVVAGGDDGSAQNIDDLVLFGLAEPDPQREPDETFGKRFGAI
jgi:hypothetical protein